MSRFNLIDERWIPVRFLDGHREELGIRQTLARSTEISGIEDASPLVTVALHRFLLAVLYRALDGPADIDQARQLFDQGIPSGRVSQYLEKWRSRFFLFDSTLPFGQVADFEPKTWRAWTVLATEHNADNAKVLFDHIDIGAAGTIAPAAAARWLLATQTFSVSSGKSELAHTGTAPSATAALVMPLGRSLQDTLLFALVPQNREILAGDLPLWERRPDSMRELKDGIERAVGGLCDLYTWRARSIRLESNDPPNVSKVAFGSGVAVLSSDYVDPMVGYRVDDKAGRLPIQFRDRGLWRDFDSLLPDNARLSPRVIEHAVALTRSFRERMPTAIAALGQANDKAKIEFWRLERFRFPPALAGNGNVRSEIRLLLEDAEDAQKSLWAACRTFARDLLSHGNARQPAKQDISKLVQQMVSIPLFWSALESAFHRSLFEFGLDHDPDDIRRAWLEGISDALLNAWDHHRISASTGSAWMLRALVKSEAPVRRKLAELGCEIEKLEQRGAKHERTDRTIGTTKRG